MTVARENVVDWLGFEKETEHVVLAVVDDLDWADEDGHIALLQAKLNAYLAFIESGEVFDQLRVELGREIATDTPMEILILAQFVPSHHGRAFREYARSICEGAGVALRFKVVGAPS